jgi:hypothetical protein
MKTTVLACALAAVAILLLAASAALACRDDPSLEDYFADLEGILDDLAENNAEVSADHPDAFADLEDTQAYYEELLPNLRDALDEIGRMEAPEEVAEEHGELEAASEAFFNAVASVNHEVQQITSDEEFETYVGRLDDNDDLNEALSDLNIACLALAGVAVGNEIVVELDCGVPEPVDPTANVILEQYLLTVKGIFGDANTAAAEAQEELNAVPAGATLDEQIAALDAYLAAVVDVFESAISRLGNLGVPEDAQAAHADFIEGSRESLAAAEALRADLADIETAEALQDRLAEFDEAAESAAAKSDAACAALQEIADAEEIEIDLECEG